MVRRIFRDAVHGDNGHTENLVVVVDDVVPLNARYDSSFMPPNARTMNDRRLAGSGGTWWYVRRAVSRLPQRVRPRRVVIARTPR
jgi:hypothetical protein